MSQSPPEASSPLAAVPNPFVRDVVGSPLDEARADVPRINVHAKRECVNLIARVTQRRESGSLLLFGEPGSGKTHLLSRLRLHLDHENAAGRHNIFVSLRMQTSPSMMWRFVRGNLTAALLRRDAQGISTLERLLANRRADLEAMHHRDLGIVLENLLNGVQVRDSAAWLRGYELPEPALISMGLSTQPVDEEFQEERAYQVILDISRLTEPVPLVFCLDQVESLQRHVDDKEGIFALGKLVATLHDTLHNAAIVCCVQTTFIDQIKGAIRGSEQDRMLANRAGLSPLNWEQTGELIAARVNSQPELAALRPAGAPPTWPLNADKLRESFQAGGTCVARKVLHRASELFTESAEQVVAPSEPLADFLARLYEDRRISRPEQESDFILRDGLPLLFQALGMQPNAPGGVGAPRPGTFDLVVEHDGRPAAFALCNQRAGLGLVNRFRKLGEKWDAAATPRLVLVRDARLGIGSNAKASHQRLVELRNRQAELVTISPEALAALDAMRSLLSDADSGDLSHNGETVRRKTVEEWLAAHLPVPLVDLVEQLKGRATADTSKILPALTALVSERKIVSMEEAARELRVEIKEVADCASQNPQQFAVLGGSGAVLFQPVRALAAS
jgi:hypothetical protein